jgi:DNA-binding transcriptional MerR regulator
MSELARLSGVPAATIKHYLREGLLPAPAVRTSRNMAYYDVALVPRIRRIKELQRTRFLPLRVIREILEESELPSADDTVAAAIARVLTTSATAETRSRAELLAAGMPEEQLDLLARLGLVTPSRPDGRRGGRRGVSDGEPGAPGSVDSAHGDERYGGDDLELLRVLAAARRAGLTPDMLPITILGDYLEALRALVAVELRLFREGVVPRAGAELSGLTEAATVLSERLVVLLRRKLLLPTLAAGAVSASAAPRAASARSGRRDRR